MPENSKDVIRKSMLNMMKSISRIQQEKSKVMLGMLEADVKTGGNIMTQILKNRMDPSKMLQRQTMEGIQSGAITPPKGYDIDPNYPRTGTGKPFVKDPVEKVPTWQQQQRIASVKNIITNKTPIIGKDYRPIIADTKEDALRIIAEAQLDPALFEDELKMYDKPAETPATITPDLQAQRQRAKDAGYTDEEIDAYLNPEPNKLENRGVGGILQKKEPIQR